jgi:hypothetical protein
MCNEVQQFNSRLTTISDGVIPRQDAYLVPASDGL